MRSTPDQSFIPMKYYVFPSLKVRFTGVEPSRGDIKSRVDGGKLRIRSGDPIKSGQFEGCKMDSKSYLYFPPLSINFNVYFFISQFFTMYMYRVLKNDLNKQSNILHKFFIIRMNSIEFYSIRLFIVQYQLNKN